MHVKVIQSADRWPQRTAV